MQSTLPFRYKICGPGEPDKKTQGLIDFSKRIPATFKGKAKPLRLSLPDSASVPPKICKDFMDKAGCNQNDDETSAKNKMQNCQYAPFDNAMTETYRFHFDGIECRSIAFSVRSGDLGASGVHSSEFIMVNTTHSESQTCDDIKNASINVLASSFSGDAKAMAPVFLELGGNGIGILTQPFLWWERKFEGVAGLTHISPAITLSFLAPLMNSDYGLVQAFHGIASKSDGVIRNEPPILATESIGIHIKNAYGFPAYGMQFGKKLTYFVSNRSAPAHNDWEEAGDALSAALLQIKGRARLHAELVCENASNLFDWAILQMSDCEWLRAAKPMGRPLYDGWLKAETVMGFADTSISGVHFAGKVPLQADAAYNEANKNYLLVAAVKNMYDFSNNWRIKDYINAGAIAIVVNEHNSLVFSHFAGALRMLGIPVFVYEKDSKGANALLGLGADAKCNIYADESISTGGIEPIAEKAETKKSTFSFWPFKK